MTDTVHVITTLGPTDGPGLIVPARLGPGTGRPRSVYAEAMRRHQEWFGDQMDQAVADSFERHRNNPCNVRPVTPEDQ